MLKNFKIKISKEKRIYMHYTVLDIINNLKIT